MLTSAGVGGRQAREVLGSGLAGVPVRTAAVHLYEVARVSALAARPLVSAAGLDSACPGGVFIARRDLDGGWDLSVWGSAWIRHQITVRGFLPLVRTIGGFVESGAEIVSVVRERESYRLGLQRAGTWFDTLATVRLPTGPGRPWVLSGPTATGWPPHCLRARSEAG